MQVTIESIRIEKRVRHDMGDLDSLMTSLRRHGQLNPVILTTSNELVAGHRRLESARRLGWLTIEAVRLENLDAIEKLELELDENLHRKDLTPEEVQEGFERLERLKHPGILRRIGLFFTRLWERIAGWFGRGKGAS